MVDGGGRVILRSEECLGKYVRNFRCHFLCCRYPRGAGRVVDVGVQFTVCEMVFLVVVHVV